jgi:Fe/S biogenesis protein NfuA
MTRPRYDAGHMTESEPLLTMTPAAAEKVARAAASAGNPAARLRVAVAVRRGARFSYDIRLVAPESAGPDDLVVETAGTQVFVDAGSVDALRGATVALDESSYGGAIRVDNPNEGWGDPVAARVQDVLDRQINPGIASHGGHIDLLDVRDGTAYIEMGGGCQGCAQVDVTLRQGVEVAVRAAVPEVVAIVDTTDHAAGTNPYYQAAKK